ncbi:MAG TPA: hypothetical protein ENJ29_11425 [Bacteroidetes bacterium]|nr:hypothetical protein [Bacteroidota bacterium]
MQATLRTFQSNTPDVEGVAVASTDGLIMAGLLPAEIEEDRVGAMCAALVALGERSSDELSRGDVRQVYVKGVNGYVVLMNIGNDAVLITITSESVKLGLLFLELKRTVQDLQKYL